MNIICLLIAIVAIYVLLAPRFAAWFYRPVLFPRLAMTSHENPPIIAEIKAKAIKFLQSNGNKLCAWFYRNPNSRFIMLVSHGNFGNMETHSYLTEALIRSGFSVFIYDYSGYGASTGLPNLNIVTNDAESAYDYLVKHEKIAPENIILYGESIGASIASHLATTRKVKALICQSGFSSFRSIVLEKMPFLKVYPKMLFPRHSLDTICSIMNLQVPVLIIHGVKDDVVLFHHAESIFKAAKLPKILISLPDCDHRNVTFADREKFISIVQEFSKSL
jgi:fermentation-respiration switch protein FrsA (DUF1100 family)